jgi:predicted small metal-binding protein
MEFNCGDFIKGCSASIEETNLSLLLQRILDHLKNSHDITNISSELLFHINSIIR